MGQPAVQHLTDVCLSCDANRIDAGGPCACCGFDPEQEIEARRLGCLVELHIAVQTAIAVLDFDARRVRELPEPVRRRVFSWWSRPMSVRRRLRLQPTRAERMQWARELVRVDDDTIEAVLASPHRFLAGPMSSRGMARLLRGEIDDLPPEWLMCALVTMERSLRRARRTFG